MLVQHSNQLSVIGLFRLSCFAYKMPLNRDHLLCILYIASSLPFILIFVMICNVILVSLVILAAQQKAGKHYLCCNHDGNLQVFAIKVESDFSSCLRVLLITRIKG